MPLLKNLLRLTGIYVLFVLALAIGTAEPPAINTPPVTPEALAFFEKNIRPVLAEQCLSCHGDKRQSANLRLDSRAGLLKGSDKGSAPRSAG